MRRLLFAISALVIGVSAHAQLFNYEMYVPSGIQEAHQIAAAPDGSLFLVDRDGLILKISAGGAVSTYAGVQDAYGYLDGPAAQAKFADPFGIAVDGTGNVYVGDTANNRIRKITPDGMVSTFAGSTYGFADGPAATALFASPEQLAFDSAGNLFVLDYNNYAVRKITPDGTVSTVFGGPTNHGALGFLSGLAVDAAGNAYVCDMTHLVVWKISGGAATVFAGQYGAQGFTDGPPGTARIAQPWSVTFDGSGNLYLTDYNVLRRVGPDGSLTTVAGEGEPHELPGTGLNPMFTFAFSALVTPSAVYIADQGHLWRGLPGALSDQAVIDARTCYPGEIRQLNATPQTAATYQWSFQTKPANSTAALSSDSIPNPTFTPDVPGFYRFALRATNGSAYSLTYAILGVSCRPPAKPVVTSSGQFSCPGQAVTLDAGDGYASYRWSTNDTTRTITVSPSSTQNYSVQGADATGCWSDGTSFTQHVFGDVPQISPNLIELCPGASPATVTVGDAGVSGIQHQWYYVDSSQQLVPIGGATGSSYSVTGTETSGSSFTLVCVSTGCNGQTVQSFATVVHETPAPPPAISVNPAAVCPNGTGYAEVTSPQSYSAFNWLIVNGAFTGSPANSYVFFHADGSGLPVQLSVTVTDPAGCGPQSASASIPIVTISAPTINVNPASLCPNGNGYAEVSNPQPYVTFNWSIVNGTFSGAANGSYVFFHPDTSGQPVQLSVAVSDFNGCTATSTASVPVITLAAPTISINPTAVCPAGSYGYASVDNSTNYATFHWTVTHGAIIGSATGSNVTYQADASGQPLQLSVTVSDFNGCTATSNPVSIPIRTLAAPTFTLYPTTLCPSGSYGQASVDNATNYATFHWTVTHGVIIDSATGSNLTYQADASGQPVEVSVTVSDFSGCVATSTPVSVPIRVLDAPIFDVTPSTLCAGGASGTGTVESASNYASFHWSIVNGFIINDANQSTVSFQSDGSGNPVQLTLAVTDFGGCTASAQQSIPVNPLPAATITADGATTFCADHLIPLSAPYAVGATYRWSNGATTRTIYVGTSGTWSVTVTGADGCSATSVAVTTTVYPLPAVSSISAPAAVCPNGTGYAASVTNDPSLTYAWTVLGGTIRSGAGTSSITFDVDQTTSPSVVTLRVTATNANGCGASSAADIPVDRFTPTITASGPTTFCAGGSVTLTASAGASYLWSNGATTQSIVVGTTGSYFVTAVDANGCSSTRSDPASVIVLQPQQATITAYGPTTFCQGGSVLLVANSGSSYLWSNGATTQSITVSQSGTYSVTVGDLATPCSTTASVTVTVNPLPATPVVTASGPTTFCLGGSVTLTAPPAASYLWSNGATTQSINVTNGGSYSVTVSDANGCSSTSTSTTVTANLNPSPDVTASGPTTFCAGGSVTLTASAASSYLWSTGATTQAITVNASGTYSVTVTDANGCSGTTARVVTVNPNPAPTITAGGPTTFCAGGSVTLSASSGGSYLWSNGATTQSINVTSSGSYSVTVTTNGCSGTSPATVVTVNANPTPTITAGGPTTFCAGGSVTLTASSGGSYLWSTGATTQSINATTSGSYSVTVTTNSCSGTSAATVATVNANPAPTITAGGPTTFCAGGNVTLTASSASSYHWSNGATTQSITVSASGSYTVTVTDANGCSGTSAATAVTVNANPAPTITAGGPTTFCAGGSVTLTASSASSYHWSNGATTQSITVNASGSYGVTVTDANGCSGTSAATAVTVNANPAPTITAGGPTTFCAGGSVTLTASSGGSYHWSNGATTQSINVTSSGSYSVTVTTTGCSGTSAATSVTALPLPTASVSGSASGCPSAAHTIQATLTGTAPWSITWSDGFVQNGITTSTVTRSVSPAATITYTITSLHDANCSGSASGSAVITIYAAPAITQQPSNVTVFHGTAFTLTVTSAGTGLTYQWYSGTSGSGTPISGATSSSYSTSQIKKGTYNYWVKVTDTCGRVVNSNTAVVTVN